MLKFEWDEKKNRSNRAKHKVWFEEAQATFDDPHARYFADENHSNEEDRFLALGMSAARLLVVVYCYRDDNAVIRIISARKATRRERVTYEEGI